MSRAIPKQTKEEIVSRVKQGERVKALANEYGVSNRAVYGWLQKQAGDHISLSKFNRLRRERDDLLVLVGELILKLKKGGKSKTG